MAGQDPSDLAGTYRELYRARFRAGVDAGTAKPLIVPYHLLVYWVIPTLYLAIPHNDRPWLFRARWLVVALVVVFHWRMICYVSSLNFASAYGAGLLGSWAIIWNCHLFIWTRPQWDAKRVEQRTRIPRKHAGESLTGPHGRGVTQLKTDGQTNGRGSVPVNGSSMASDHHGVRERHTSAKRGSEQTSPDTSTELIEVAGTNCDAALGQSSMEHVEEYHWQEFPADASFWVRLDWAFDIVSSFRLTGWNWAPSYLPPYGPPPRSTQTHQEPLDFYPHRSRQGYERTISLKDFVLRRLVFSVIPTYLLADLCATIMTTDPYFIAGPEHGHPLPEHLSCLHPLVLSLSRTLLAFVAIISALQFVWNVGALFLAICCRPILGFRVHPWHLPTMMGSFDQVLDRGLAGFWGAWWHQSFRSGFSAPTKWLLRRGYIALDKDSGGFRAAIGPLTATTIAFANSAFLHSAASYSTVPETRIWGPPLFFALSGLGVSIQSALSSALRHGLYGGGPSSLPRWMCGAGNLAFVSIWLWATAWLLIDDFSRCGLWLWEPVPFSLARAAGFGSTGDRRIWRYDADFLPQWHWGTGGRWWETGFAI